ncbi:MAG: XRE family transcriptional regulator [Clostridia bacterium]|nr:XRE family transcriptional regulator [Clostridia bacterium]MBR0414210.1 XRE family transcriptional regulator [Clostridia bacterium]
MVYVLKHFDTDLIKFSAESGAEMNIEVLWFNDRKAKLFPLDLAEVSAKGIESWLKHRTVPKNRAYVDNLLSSMGLSINRPLDVIKVSKGLSLNDCYWVCEEGSTDTFDAVNLYDNRFSRVLSQIAFTGYGSSNISAITTSPEFTTNGMLPKCWCRVSGKILLYKGGTEGFSNTGNEPYSEFYASQIAKALEVNAIDYKLAKFKGRICSTCELFTSKEVSFVPVGRIVRTGGMAAVKEYYRSLGKKYTEQLNDMFLLDAVIMNVDRHFGNFGFLVDSKTNKIIAPAPLFDHGNSLLNFAGRDVLEDFEALEKYSKTLLPCVYDDFFAEIKPLLTHRQKNNLRKLLTFKFKKNARYNLDDKRLKMLEKIIQNRAKELLD